MLLDDSAVHIITYARVWISCFQRWMINGGATVFDDVVGRNQIVSRGKGADWTVVAIFVWDATLHTLSSDAAWEFTGAGQFKMNSKWKHGCDFTDNEVRGMYLYNIIVI